MDIVSIIILAIGLSFDSFAVSICSGVAVRKIVFWNAVKIALSMAVFQASFPLIGWLIGHGVKSYVEAYDHWFAFLLLMVMGGKMIYDSIRKEDNSEKLKNLKFATIIALSIATSIDAFVVGISFGFIEINILLAAIIIGSVTFFASMIGILFGKKSSGKLGKHANLAGGLILIGIGAKILIEHTLLQ